MNEFLIYFEDSISKLVTDRKQDIAIIDNGLRFKNKIYNLHLHYHTARRRERERKKEGKKSDRGKKGKKE